MSPRGDIELVAIPGGKFWMGSSSDEIARLKRQYPESEVRLADEAPRHEVALSPFFIASTPVTNAQYARFLDATADARKPDFWADRRYNRPDQPVVGVSWEDAHRFCQWAGVQLPTEAQWEYACRAGTETRYWSGDASSELERVGWFAENSDSRLHAVALKPANPWGLLDMHGNIWEWCADRHGGYSNSPQRDPAGPAAGSDRVFRGGGFGNNADWCRSAFRGGWLPSARGYSLGFRVALPAAPSST